MAEENPPDWPEECPACGEATEEHPRTLSWWCPACGMDEDGLRELAEDARVERAIEARKEAVE